MSTVTSPAGESMELVDEPASVQWKSTGPLVMALWFEGAIVDRAGRCTSMLHERARRYGYLSQPSAVNHQLHHGALGRFIGRETNGSKRTYSVRLSRLPAEWHPLLLTSPRAPRKAALPAVLNGDVAPEPEPVMNDIPAIDLMTGMLMAVRRDEHVPIRALPVLQEWLAQTERVLVELDRGPRRK